MNIEHTIPFLENILEPWKGKIGNNYEGYKNHVYRVLHFCFYLHDASEEERQKLLISAAFHDLGIWSGNTFDYLPPSVAQAKIYLKENGLEHWSNEIELIINMHHKLTRYTGHDYPLVEIFRKGDLVDFSLGIVKCGVSNAYVKQVKATFPNAGFHKRLLQLTSAQVKNHPLNPAPMFKW